MAQKRYSVECPECGALQADTSDGLFSKTAAYRRAGFHEGMHDGQHTCDVEVAEKTKEYRCPVCHTKCVGERERNEHARTEPGVNPDMFTRV